MTFTSIVRTQSVESWSNRPLDQITQSHAVIYDHWHADQRSAIDNLKDLPYEKDGLSVEIYDEDGFRIHRRCVEILPEHVHRRHGVLVDLAKIGHLFEGIGHRRFEEELAGTTIQYQVFPQAFLGQIGHFQAKGLMSPFRAMLSKVNHEVAVVRRGGVNHEDIADLDPCHYSPINP